MKGELMGESKKYRIPDELKGLNSEVNALYELRDAYVKRPFGYKKAKRAALEFVKKKREFWYKLKIVYPEIKGKTMGVRDGDYVEEMEGQAFVNS